MKSNHAPNKDEILEELLSPPAGSPPEFSILASPFRFGEGSSEALAIDSVGRLALVMLGQKEEEPWLLSILDAIAWTEKHRPLLLTRFHLAKNPPDPALRLVLAAQDFSKEFRARIETVGCAKIDLFEWEAVEIAGERKLVFRRVLQTERSRDAQGFPSWALDPQGASMFRESVEKIAKIDPEIALDWGPFSLDLRFRGRLLASFLPDSLGLRVRLPGGNGRNLAVDNRAALTKALDLVFREYIGTELEAAESPAPALETETPQNTKSPRPRGSRTSLTAEEMEAIAK